MIPSKRKRGSVLAFALMIAIALLAMGVVVVSRVVREEENEQPDVTSESVPGDPVGLEFSAEPTTATGDLYEDSNVSATTSPVIMAPPPPPLVTPDTRNLPPEG